MFHTSSAAVVVTSQEVSQEVWTGPLTAKTQRNVLTGITACKAWLHLAPSLTSCLDCFLSSFCPFLRPSLTLLVNPRIRGSPSQSDHHFDSSEHLFFTEIRFFLWKVHVRNSCHLSMYTTLLFYTEDSEVLDATKSHHMPLRISDKCQPGGKHNHSFFICASGTTLLHGHTTAWKMCNFKREEIKPC